MSRAWLIVPLLIIYVLHLGGVGFLGPDEPRYASVGREMARSGDLITPRLDGQPWFEKPPLLYWMIAAGHWLRLPDEWAARLPVALASILFLTYFFGVVAQEFHPRTAVVATAVLATSAGWVAYSFAALTDLPMSAALASAMLMTLFGTRTVDTRLNIGWIAGGILGLAILGKGLVPAVLFAPLLLIARGRRIAVIVGAIVIAAPWHILCWIQNGAAFWDDYFWKQHVARFFTPGLEHVQPFWYYIPVLLAGLFPWTPLVALLARKRIYDDVRVTLLTAWILYGFIFFSAARNKLPGYILPLMPAIAIALAVAFDKAPRKEWWLAGCAAMLVVLPVVSAILPAALLSGIRRTDFSFPWSGLLSLAAAGFVWWLARQRYSDLAVLAVALAAGLGILYMKSTTFPLLDRAVSVRAFWRMNRNAVEDGCLGEIRRAWAYGLNYYAGRALPVCSPEYSEKKRVIGISETLSIMVP